MSSWCGNEEWGPSTDDQLDLTPCFREVVLETSVPLLFVFTTITFSSLSPWFARQWARRRRLSDPRLSGPGPIALEDDEDTATSHATPPRRIPNGVVDPVSASLLNGNDTAYTTRATTASGKQTRPTAGQIEDVALLLSPKDTTDLDERPEDKVTHPTSSDIFAITATMLQSLNFLALMIVRWKYLELGGPHGHPGHIHQPSYRFVMPVVQCISWLYALVLCIAAAFTRRFVQPSRIRRMLIVFSSFMFINALLRTRTSYRRFQGKELDDGEGSTPRQQEWLQMELIFALINMVLVSIFAGVIGFTSKGPDVYFEGRKVSSEVNASLFCWTTYNWMNDLMWEGYARALELEDLPSLTDRMRARPSYKIFARTRTHIKAALQPSLLWRIYECNRRDIWINLFFGIISSITAFGVPYYLKLLLEYIEEPNGPKELAYLYVFAMLISDVTRSLAFGQNLYYGRRVEVRLKAMLSAEIYAKSLRRKDMTGIVTDDNNSNSNASATKASPRGTKSDSGMITNLMAVDANRIATLFSYIFYLYTCPIEIAIALVLLYQVLGLSSLVGVAIMLLTMPAHHFAAKKYVRIQEQLMQTRDRRVGLMTELLQGIRMIKFFAWEKNIQRKIMEIRDQELRRFVRLFIINSFFTLLWFGSPILVTVMSFTSYTKLEHKTLTSSVAFAAMALYLVLRQPLNTLPGMVTDLLEAKVSLRRIEHFLNEGEVWKYREEAISSTGNSNSPGNIETTAIVEDESMSPLLQPHQSSPPTHPMSSQQQQHQRGMSNPDKIGFTNATFRWHTRVANNLPLPNDVSGTANDPLPGTFMLRHLTLHFPVGKLSLIVGPTGSGKTSLLMALLREMDLLSGTVHLPRPTSKIIDARTGLIPGTVAYVSQHPWLQQASIRDNILFGSHFEPDRYQHVLESCGLLPDLAVFEHGDLTEIGEKGVTLSGGQKQRVALARACYSRAQHLLLDDCLSAVDAHTARHLFDRCLTGPLMQGRTRILVTHHVRLCLRDSNFVALLKEGQVAMSGSPLQVIRSGLLREILERDGTLEEEPDRSASSTLVGGLSGLPVVAPSPAAAVAAAAAAAIGSPCGAGADALSINSAMSSPRAHAKHPIGRGANGCHGPGSGTGTSGGGRGVGSGKTAKKLVDEEERSKGRVRWFVYNMYLKACGGPGFWVLLVLIPLIVRLLGMAEVFWLRVWTSAYPLNQGFMAGKGSSGGKALGSIFKIRLPGTGGDGDGDGGGGGGGDDDDDDLDYYIGIYCFITLMAVFLTIVRMFWQFYGSLRASRSLYEELLAAVIRAPIRFFDTTPVGRIVNRFSKDFEVIDSQMIQKMASMLINMLAILSVVVIISFVTPGFLIAAVFISAAYIYVGMFYITSSRELKRLESITKSPLYSHFGETLVGVSTIRAFGAEHRFMEEVLVKLDNNNAPYYFLWMCNRWLCIRVDIMGALVSFIAGILILINLEHLDAGWAGISLASALNFMGLFYWLVRIYTEMEMALNSVERVHEYLQMPQEPPAIIPGSRPPAGWPYDGSIEFRNLTVQYAHDLDPALRNITITVRPREKIGVVGRTGSGKSTLALSLFRFMDPMSGSISIDGIDISKIGLEDLRRRLTIIPQDAVLFNGTIRSNLDPFQEHEDHEIWEALRRVHLVSPGGTPSDAASAHSLPSSPYLSSPQGTDSSDAYLTGGGGSGGSLGGSGAASPAVVAASVVAPYDDSLCDDPHAACNIEDHDGTGINLEYPGSTPMHDGFDTTPVRVVNMTTAAATAAAAVKQPIHHHHHPSHPFTGTSEAAVQARAAAMEAEIMAKAAAASAQVHPSGALHADEDEPCDMFWSLDSPVSDGGHNFSQGQRQLLCLARALLRESRIIVMDEATASVDLAMDEKIQATIRNELGDSTLICIAHRLRTIMDYDRVLVLDQGQVMEFDSPLNLITNPSSRFRDMIEKSGECEALFEMIARAY
ncbi:hypothetical protein DFQ27_003732 [Actinomortierella ambigua]|uniref:Uncharacterized protein n=1 Tax=Actinomortierella ambigua TaxID=1343610 RepID=A0A9P6U5J9_9FUNG|nr:hypothetical protein DFQ27_003732 [Actinomortierella ambigua]